MIKIGNIEVFNFKAAIRGMRNPMNSHHLSDSNFEGTEYIGIKDLTLMRKLYKGGTEHRKFLRQILVSMDICAPLYWWKEFDTYKIGTTANSTSTMHKIHSKEFTLSDFSYEHLKDDPMMNFTDEDGNYYTNSPMKHLKRTIDLLNAERSIYLATQSKEDWWQMIQTLPSTYNQTRTVSMNYENVMNIINQREFHKLDEWRYFVKELKKLPYVKTIRGNEE